MSMPSDGQLRVEDVAAFAAGAGHHDHPGALGRVFGQRRRALARLVVRMGVHGHQPQRAPAQRPPGRARGIDRGVERPSCPRRSTAPLADPRRSPTLVDSLTSLGMPLLTICRSPSGPACHAGHDHCPRTTDSPDPIAAHCPDRMPSPQVRRLRPRQTGVGPATGGPSAASAKSDSDPAYRVSMGSRQRPPTGP